MASEWSNLDETLEGIFCGTPQALSIGRKKSSEFGKLQSLDSQLLAKSLILCLAIVGVRPENPNPNPNPKTSDLRHIQFLCETSPC
jgi:hypothetical protein